jgi:hypothetical protein
MPIGIQWARDSEFNWTFDNMGGCPLQTSVSGLWSGVFFTVYGNTVTIPASYGGGSVYYVWGVWSVGALFSWSGFWTLPETGESNLFGSFQNFVDRTVIQLNTPTPDGTPLQVYYIYNTGEKSGKYTSLNSTPCIRKAIRSATDYTFDFAVDRIFDCMAAVYFGYKEQYDEYPTDLLNFLFETYLENAASNANPLVYDQFNRSFYDRGSYLLYYNSSNGQTGFDSFGTALPPEPEGNGRALRFKPHYYGGITYSAWWGYGFNWDLTQTYFNTINAIKFKAKGACNTTKVQKFIRTAGTGNSTMILDDSNFAASELKYYCLTIDTGGSPGVATATVKVYGPDLKLESTTAITTPAMDNYINLGNGLKAKWQGDPLAAGDTWYVTVGSQEIYSHRLLISLNNSLPTDPDPWGTQNTFVHAIPDCYSDYQDFEIGFDQFWRLNNIIDCRDRKQGYWGNWSSHYMNVGTPYEMLFYDIQNLEAIDGELYYTKQKFSWNLNTSTTVAIGFYVGIPSDVDSTFYSHINFKIKPYDTGDRTYRCKVRDANGHYFHCDVNVVANYWNYIQILWENFEPETNGTTLTHPLNLVDIGIPDTTGTGHPGSVPAQGSFEIVDLKFDNHVTFSGSNHLRIVEFKYQETALKLSAGPDWYVDDFGFNMSVNDPYPYVPRLAISLNAYGRNPWRGPTLVHYSHPLAPYLVGNTEIKNTELRLHLDAQIEFNARYGGILGPIMPVHTRNDIENIALCGEENFNKFCWWPDYPETKHALGQYWAFYRLAEYFYVSNDYTSWGVLNNWLNWFSTYLVADGAGWKFPIWFGEEHAGGFIYDTGNYDPGAAASIVLGCLYVYMRNGDSRALSLSQKILADLRQHRASGDYGGYLYKSDYHYAWMNALVAHAFGLAVTGRTGQAFTYPSTTADNTHFRNMINNFFASRGDSKPNLFNSDMIPFHDAEPHDIWDYAPNYIFMKEMGSMEGVVLMMHTAVDWGIYSGDWWWFNKLLKFLFRAGEGTLTEQQIYGVRSNFMTSENLTQVALTFGDYRKDNTSYREAENQTMIALVGRIKALKSMNYGSPVITEDSNTAANICNRTLNYFSIPKERVQVTADLSAARLDLDDLVKLEAPFHGYAKDKFAITRRMYDQKNLRVVLDLMRDIDYINGMAVNTAGGSWDTYAITYDDDTDVHWASRAHAN